MFCSCLLLETRKIKRYSAKEHNKLCYVYSGNPKKDKYPWGKKSEPAPKPGPKPTGQICFVCGHPGAGRWCVCPVEGCSYHQFHSGAVLCDPETPAHGKWCTKCNLAHRKSEDAFRKPVVVKYSKKCSTCENAGGTQAVCCCKCGGNTTNANGVHEFHNSTTAKPTSCQSTVQPDMCRYCQDNGCVAGDAPPSMASSAPSADPSPVSVMGPPNVSAPSEPSTDIEGLAQPRILPVLQPPSAPVRALTPAASDVSTVQSDVPPNGTQVEARSNQDTGSSQGSPQTPQPSTPAHPTAQASPLTGVSPILPGTSSTTPVRVMPNSLAALEPELGSQYHKALQASLWDALTTPKTPKPKAGSASPVPKVDGPSTDGSVGKPKYIIQYKHLRFLLQVALALARACGAPYVIDPQYTDLALVCDVCDQAWTACTCHTDDQLIAAGRDHQQNEYKVFRGSSSELLEGITERIKFYTDFYKQWVGTPKNPYHGECPLSLRQRHSWLVVCPMSGCLICPVCDISGQGAFSNLFAHFRTPITHPLALFGGDGTLYLPLSTPQTPLDRATWTTKIKKQKF